MRYFSTLAKLFFATFLVFGSIGAFAQTILNYTTDTSGALFYVAPNASGTSLTRVNGAVEPAAPCTAGGYSSTNYTSVTTYSNTLPGVEVTSTPTSGYSLNVTGFSVDLRRSATGPDSVRYAYSTDGGATWIDQGISQNPNTGSCGAVVTKAWSVPIVVSSPNTLQFRVYGFSAGGTSGTFQLMNLVINGTVASVSGCTTPSGLSSSGITSSSATVNWLVVTGAVSYNIQYRPVGSSTWSTATSTSTSVNLTGLVCSTTYEYQVQTVCTGGGTSSFTPSSTFTTSGCVCPVPTGIDTSGVTASSVNIIWTAATGAIGYNFQYRLTGTTTWTTLSPTTNADLLTGLPCGTSYDCRVQTICSSSTTSAYSSIYTFSTLSCACPSPTGITATAVTTTAATLNWAVAVGAIKYIINYKQSGATTWTADSVTVPTTTYAITGLTCGSTYLYRIKSECSVSSYGSFSSLDSFNTSACLCPTPTGLTITAATTTTATLSWTSLVWAAYYNIEYRKVGTTTWITDSSNTNSKTITGLLCGTNYEYKVQTVCGGLGIGSYSTTFAFNTNSCSVTGSTGNIAVYFNQPVNTAVSTGVNAKYLNACMADTIVAYINRAKYSIDIAQYDYNQSSGYANIATAVNNAYLAGKKVRWIYDGSQSNTGLALLNAGIPKVASPTTSSYGIMHNKFVIIDANSTNPTDAILNTGSEDWGITQFNSCYNNTVFIQDSALAHVYKMEFDMMWGDTGIVPNPTVAKFGPFKTDLGRHTFNIGGKTVELYFSPSDGTDSHIQSTINSANTDLYFGVYTFTGTTDANDIIARQTAGVYTAGIVDQYSNTSAAYPILSTGLGTNLETFVGAGALVYHNKMLIVDPSNFCSDPMVLTGSHNWTTTANTKNDENILIFHDGTIANIYYQSFNQNFTNIGGGTLTSIVNCSTLHTTTPAFDIMDDGNSLIAFPNPVQNTATISYHLSNESKVSLSIMNIVGQEVSKIVPNELQQAGDYSFSASIAVPGVYFVKLTIGDLNFTKKVVKI